MIVTRPAALKRGLGLRRVQTSVSLSSHNKALVRTLTRVVVRRAPVAPLRLASRLARPPWPSRGYESEFWCDDDRVLPLGVRDVEICK